MLDNKVQEGAGTIWLRATLPNADHYFWPGQFVKIRLVLSTIEGAVLVPARCVQIGQAGTYVYVVNAQSVAEMRPVKLGQLQGDLMVIESGVQAGEQVVLNGQMMLAPGAPVAITNPPAKQ